MQIEELLYNIFFSYINCSCQGKTVVILEKVYTDRRILECMYKIMFRKLKIERIELALSCVTPLYLSGKYSGLVVSAGATSVEIMAVSDGYPLFAHYQCLNIGTNNLNKYIRDDLALLNK
jgi:actin-related protein